MLCGILLAGCGAKTPLVDLAGSTMGTSWHVSYVPESTTGELPGADETQKLVQARLDTINDSMSTYISQSEISRFNASPVGEWFPVSEGFLAVLESALEVGTMSHGAYDVTVAPLVNLWGFGPGREVYEPPAGEAISKALANVGQQAVTVDRENRSIRKDRDLSLDFSSLAKGYAVDEVARLMTEAGIMRFLVEVGGEMKLSGMSARGDLWRVGIEQPATDVRSAAVAVALTDVAVATSGDYRNYFDHDGQRYSHTIDPRTGYPVQHDLVSVTVVHDSAMSADAWATALLVLGSKEGLRLASEHNLAVYFIRRAGDNYLHEHTAAFNDFLAGEVTAEVEENP